MKPSLLIFLHGSGSDGFSLATLIENMRIESYKNKTFIYVSNHLGFDILVPTAPEIPYSPSQGELKNVWYDRHHNFRVLGRKAEENIESVQLSLNYVRILISDILKSKY
jgi:hypothetical protein